MTNPEINKAVARKMGLIPEPTKYYGIVWCKPGTNEGQNLKDYCINIAAAWEIVEKLSDIGFCVMKVPYEKTWKIVVGSEISKIGFEVRADTAPMAICLAFLKI